MLYLTLWWRRAHTCSLNRCVCFAYFMLRWITGKTRKDNVRKHAGHTRGCQRIGPICQMSSFLWQTILNSHERIRREDDNLSRKMMNMVVPGNRRRRRRWFDNTCMHGKIWNATTEKQTGPSMHALENGGEDWPAKMEMVSKGVTGRKCLTWYRTTLHYKCTTTCYMHHACNRVSSAVIDSLPCKRWCVVTYIRWRSCNTCLRSRMSWRCFTWIDTAGKESHRGRRYGRDNTSRNIPRGPNI